FAASYTQTGTASTTFNSTQDYSGAFSFTGTSLAVNNPLTAGGAVSILDAVDVTFGASAAVTAAGFTQAAGTGTTTFNGVQNYSGGFSLTGASLAVNNSLQTDTGAPNGDGAIVIGTAATPANFTVGASGHILPAPGTGGPMTVTGTTNNSGTIRAGAAAGTDPVTDTSTNWLTDSVSYAIVFDGDYAEDDTGLLTGNNTSTLIAFKGNVSFGNKPYPPSPAPPPMPDINNFGWLVFLGTADQTFTTTNNRILPNVLIYHSAGTGVILSGSVPQRGSHLIIRQGLLNLNGGDWLMDSSDEVPVAGSGFTGTTGTLSLNTGTRLRSGDNLTLNDGFIVSNGMVSGPAVLEAVKDITLESGAILFPLVPADPPRTNLTLEWTGTGTGAVIKAAVEVGNLTLADGSSEGTLTLDAPLKLAGTVNIGKNKTLDVSDGSHKITLQGSWIQSSTGLTDEPKNENDDGKFIARNGVVEFGVHPYSGTAKTFIIAGNTNFYALDCFQERSTLEFSVDPHVHTITHRLSVFPSDETDPKDPTYHHKPGTAAMIKINRHDWRLAGGGLALPLTPDVTGDDYIPPQEMHEPAGQFWNFDLISQGSLGLNYVIINYSYSKRKIPLPPPESTLDWRIDAAPYVDISSPGWSVSNPNYNLADPAAPQVGSYYNVNWFVGADFFYSFTEDSDGNGKIDRLRLQSAFEIVKDYVSGDEHYGHDPFEGFEIEVENEAGGKYEVTGFCRADMAPLNVAGNPNLLDNIYVLLKEQDYTDSGARLSWTIKNNLYLKDLSTKSILLGQIEGGFNSGLAWDTAPPRINYALTIPASGRKELYFQTSEPVDITKINDNTGLRVSFPDSSNSSTGFVSLNPSGDRANQFLIHLNSPYNAADLALNVPEFMLDGVQDLAEEAADLRLGELYSYHYPSPKYPETYEYRDYYFVRGHEPGGLPGDPPSGQVVVGIGGHNKMDGRRFGFPGVYVYGKGKHRVTDVLVSVPPQNKNDPRYFVWPIWARYTDPANPSAPPALGDEDFWGQQINDTGIIWDFTGAKTLEDRKTTIQVRVNDSLNTSSPPVLESGAKIPGNYHARPVDGNGYGHGNPGFLLPAVPGILPPPAGTPPGFINLTPDYYHFTKPALVSSSGRLFVFDLQDTDSGYESGSRLEFLLRLGDSPEDLFAARLAMEDLPPGAEIPEDWYQRVRPFSYGIRDVSIQRGGATILNNVINPNNGERTYIRYHLVKGGRVTVQVFTMDGNLVKILRRENRSAGEWIDSWDGTNNGGRTVARGMYFIRVVGPDIDEIRKVMVVK
ncbi:MAG: T9SS type A sorting domain-containing protein, partial [Spirochaetaceae bacterium]|nr:T9SS type A sorting domain-containing protein [Spirochaetaceae bacterium]